ncbi:hypothetical protein LLH03_07415 [bacterium]|nr:hypothetical protein [bacterium]
MLRFRTYLVVFATLSCFALPTILYAAPHPLVGARDFNGCAFAPDGGSMLFGCKNGKEWEIRRLDLRASTLQAGVALKASDATLITTGVTPVPFLGGGRLLFVRRGKEGGLWVRDMSGGREVQLRKDPFFGLPPTISANGRLVLVSRSAGKTHRIGTIDVRTGDYKSLAGDDMTQPALNAAGTRLLFIRAGQVWVRDLTSGKDSQLTRVAFECSGPTWGPGDQTLAFAAADTQKSGGIGLLNLSTGQLSWVATGLREPASPSIAPDGRSLVYIAGGASDKDMALYRLWL